MIDIEALAREAGLEPRGSDFDRATGRWDEDTDLHIVGQDGISLPFLRAYTNAVLEAAARECDDVMPEPGGGYEFNEGTIACAAAIRALQVKP